MGTNTLRKKIFIPFTARALMLVLSVLYLRVDANPVASFAASQVIGCPPLNIQFTNTSTGATSFYWDLGNGNTSTLPNPGNLYTIPGSYTITLVATDASGNQDQAIYTGYITVVASPAADFYTTNLASCLDNNRFTFINTSQNATSYLWDFGDGNTSTTPNPSHSYAMSGTFTVTLLASNTFGCQDVKIINQYITIYPKPEAQITTNSTSTCVPTTAFQFTNNDPSANTWSWDFGDNTSSATQNPQHVFPGPGTYSVSLITSNGYGCRDTTDSVTKIFVGVALLNNFSSNSDTGCAPLSVQFNSTITYADTLLWDFGDGSTSTSIYPVHIYSQPGNYTVSLHISIHSCSSTLTRNNFIQVGLKPTPSFTFSGSAGCAPLGIQFTNTSTDFVSCQWFFGDGTTSNSLNPYHTYTNSGVYDVTLKCWGQTGCAQSIVYHGIISVTSIQAAVNASPRLGCSPLDVDFSAFTSGGGLTYHWDYGDGTSSNQQNPTHTYLSSGNFDVTLVVQDSIGCTDTILKPAYIQIVNPTANYIPPPTTVGCHPLTAQFTNATVGTTSWNWDFGDGSISNLQNPVHTYDIPGFYHVSLTTTSIGGGCAQTIDTFSTFDVRGGFAGFTHTDSPCPPYESVFTDSSLNAVSWLWDFGDGDTSTLQNPNHFYQSPGYHSVSLQITTGDGCSYTTMQSNSVYFPPFGAHFYAMSADTTFPQDVQFYANSVGATAWYWDFGDSTSSTLENPFHTFQNPGSNTTLTITNGTCTLFYDPPPLNFGNPDTISIDLGNQGLPEVQRGCIPLNVTFTNHIAGSAIWHWDFGDGDTSNVEFPSHVYANPGIYTVSLFTIDTLGIPQSLVMDSIVRASGPQAGFIVSQVNNCTNTEITLIDTSKRASRWFWDFGDGTVDSIQNPIHIFDSSIPNYVITQQVTDTMGCSNAVSTSIFSNFVSPILLSESDICGPDTVHFYTSLQNFAYYHWDFGDGTSSNAPTTSHLYTQTGVFNVTLTITDNSGCVQNFQVSPPVTVNLPTADFTTVYAQHGCDRLTTQFTNLSVNAGSYMWNFGDGNVSTVDQPFHTYTDAGVYDVSLTVYSGNCTSTIVKAGYIKVDTAHADFSYTTDQLCIPVTTQFTDLSTNPVSWTWILGDNDSAFVQNPLHTYNLAPGGYFRLYMTDINGCSDTAIQVNFGVLQADFWVSETSGCLPLDVTFINYSHGADQWFWDFGDGTTSTDADPVHTYTQAGTFNVTQIVYSHNTNCTDTVQVNALIHAKQPHADFVSPNLAACAPSIVNFTDLSVDADSYLWNFGDSTTSTNSNPSHIYNRPGFYTVSLVVKNDEGCEDSLTKLQYIQVMGPITDFSVSAFEGCAPFTVDFTDQSYNAVQWNWNFGDGYADTITNATHVFQDSGSYAVSLITRDTSGCSSFFEYPQRILIYARPSAAFLPGDTSGCVPFLSSFTNQTVGATSYTWDFADGSASGLANPTHEFQTSGYYDVTLYAQNDFGCTDTANLIQPIHAFPTPQAAFTQSSYLGCAPMHVDFTNSSLDLDNPSYLWDFGNNQTSNAASPTIVYTVPGTFLANLIVTNANGCADTVSGSAMTQVYDGAPPPESKILSVSVASDSKVNITWENNPAIDLAGYVLYRKNPSNNIFEVIYTDTNIQNTGFALNPVHSDPGLNTLRQSYTYKLQAVDLCGNAIPLDQLTAHTTIDVTSRTAGPDIRVSWSPYGGCPVNTYEIYRSAHGESLQHLASVPHDSLAYTDTVTECPYPYTYQIVATDLCGNPYVSFSDTSTTTPINRFANQVVDVVRSTVVNNQYILTEWSEPTVLPGKVTRYDIYRSIDNLNFTYIESVAPLQTDYTDYNVDVQNNSYFYKVLVINTCDITEDLSQNTSSILLKGDINDARQVHLEWSPYKGWDPGVEYYILEKMDENGHWQVLKQVDGSTYHYDYQE